MTQGKNERWHRSLKNIVNLQNYYSPAELKTAIERFVQYYNHQRYHESLDNMTPADVYFGKEKEVQSAREKIKQETLALRRQQNLIPVGVESTHGVGSLHSFMCDPFSRNRRYLGMGGKGSQDLDNLIYDVGCNPQPQVNWEKHHPYGSDRSSIRKAG